MTNIALITTTIHVPEVLRRYREIGSDVEIIVAGDVTTDAGCEALCREVDACYLSYVEQARLYPVLSDLIGPRSIQRRNIAILEAIRNGADIILTIDTDNWPDMPDYFAQLVARFAQHDGPMADGDWWNPGGLAGQPYYYRGLPYSQRGTGSWGGSTVTALAATDVPQVGIVNSLVLGDPDINATERLERHPVVAWYGRPAKQGVLVDPQRTFAPFNSQATAYLRELAPLAAVIPGVGRYDDIFGSYIAQAVLRATDYGVLYGAPFVRQVRHEHNLYSDLRSELWGMEHTEAFAETLREIVPGTGSVLDELDDIAAVLSMDGRWSHLGQFCQAWLDAVDEVL